MSTLWQVETGTAVANEICGENSGSHMYLEVKICTWGENVYLEAKIHNWVENMYLVVKICTFGKNLLGGENMYFWENAKRYKSGVENM